MISGLVANRTRLFRGVAIVLPAFLLTLPSFGATAPLDDRETQQALDLRNKTQSPVVRFDPIIVTATRSLKQLFDVPATANLISESDIAGAIFQTVPEVLREQPGVMVQ